MIGVTGIGTYVPSTRLSSTERAAVLGVAPSFVEEKIGFVSLATKAGSETTLSMAISAVEDLLRRQDLAPTAVDALVVITQNPDRNIPHVSAEVHGHFGMEMNCACFDISLGCSGYVYGLSVLSSFMESNGLKNGILVTSDPYSKIVDPNDKNTSLIFGDAATATLLSENAKFDLGKFSFMTKGSEANNLATVNGKLFMNGRAVFNFAAGLVPENIKNLLLKNDLTLDDVDAFIFHQGSRYMLDTIAQRLGVQKSKVIFAATQYGNTVSSSIPLILSQELVGNKAKTIVLCGFGLGFSLSSTVIKIRG